MSGSLEYKISLDASALDAGSAAVDKFGKSVQSVESPIKSVVAATTELRKSAIDIGANIHAGSLGLIPIGQDAKKTIAPLKNSTVAVDRLKNSMRDGSHIMRVFSSSSSSLSQVLQGDFVGAMISAGAALNSFKSIMGTMKFGGIVGIIASAIAAGFLLYEKSCKKALEQTMKIADAWTNAKATIQSLFIVSPEKRANAMFDAGDMHALEAASKSALKNYDDAANRFLEAKERWEDALEKGNTDDALNIYAKQMADAGVAIKASREELETFNAARDELRKNREAEVKESVDKAQGSLAQDVPANEMMKAEKEGPEAVETLHRKRAADARLESVYYMGSDRSVQAQAEKARLEKVALENEAAADRIKADREAQQRQATEGAAASKETYRQSKLSPEQRAAETEARMKAISAKGPGATPAEQQEYWDLASKLDELRKAIENNTKSAVDKTKGDDYWIERADAQKNLADMRKPVKKSIGYSEMFERMYATQGLFIGMKGRKQTAFGRRNERFQKSRDSDQELLDYNKEQARLLKIIAVNSQGIK